MLLPALAVVALMGATGSCSKNTEKSDARPTLTDSVAQHVEFETYIYDMIAHAEGDSLAQYPDSVMKWRLTGDGVLPTKVGEHDITLLRDTLMKLAQVKFLAKQAFPGHLDGMKITDLEPASTAYANTNVNSLSLDLMSPYLIVWERYVYNYFWGAAHGDYSTTYINYSTVDNKILTLRDLFRKGYEEELLEIVRENLREQDLSLFVEPEEITLPDNFRIRSNGISLIYPLYTIAPYAEGEIKVNLSVYDLDGLLTPRALELILGPQSHY